MWKSATFLWPWGIWYFFCKILLLDTFEGYEMCLDFPTQCAVYVDRFVCVFNSKTFFLGGGFWKWLDLAGPKHLMSIWKN